MSACHSSLAWALAKANRCLPRNVRPSVALGSLPTKRLCRFKDPTQRQCGHGDCFREKLDLQLRHIAYKMKGSMEHPDFLPEECLSRRVHFTALPTAQLRSENLEKGGDGT